jgi:hypothetical protein
VTAHIDFGQAPLRIERDTGAIHVKGSSLILGAKMQKSEFLKSDLYAYTQSARIYELQNGSGHCFLLSYHDPVFENVHFRLSFENDSLGSVGFAWGPHVSIPEWTEARVQADVRRYRAFLISQLGPIATFPHEFSWGRVYAAKDQKSGTPATGIRYARFQFRGMSH